MVIEFKLQPKQMVLSCLKSTLMYYLCRVPFAQVENLKERIIMITKNIHITLHKS